MVNKITKWLYLEPLTYSQDYLHLEEISKKLKKNHSVVRQYLNFFEKQGIVTKKIKGRLTLYGLNLENPFFIDHIILIEIEKLIRKSQQDLIIREIAQFLKNRFPNSKIIIFGSSVRDSKKSKDIDILITGDVDKEKIKEIEKKINKKFHIINPENLKDIKDALKTEVKKNHLIIQGTEEVVKWLV